MGTSAFPGTVQSQFIENTRLLLDAERELARMAADLAEERRLRIEAEERARAAELALAAAGRPLVSATRAGAAA